MQPLLHDSTSRNPTLGRVCLLSSADKLTSMSVFLHSVEHLYTLNTQLLASLADKVGHAHQQLIDAKGVISLELGPWGTMLMAPLSGSILADPWLCRWWTDGGLGSKQQHHRGCVQPVRAALYALLPLHRLSGAQAQHVRHMCKAWSLWYVSVVSDNDSEFSLDNDMRVV